MHEPERRHLEAAELRADVTDPHTPRLVGYAIRTNSLSEPLAAGAFRERITDEAVRRALAAEPDLVVLVNHDPGRVLGRRSAKTLRVAQDAHGLSFEVDVPAHEAGLVASVARGDLPFASFEFTDAKNTWDFTTTPATRTITDMRLREISVGVPFPAYESTTVAVALRALDAATEELTMPTPPAPPVPDPVPPVAPDVHLDTAVRAFSLRALIAGAAGLPGAEWGRERELSQEIARRAGRPFQGYAVPLSVFEQRVGHALVRWDVEPGEQRVVTSTLPAGGPGGNIIATDYRGDQYIDRLRAALRIRQLGARILTGLTGNVTIGRLKTTGSATSGWVAENAGLTASDIALEQAALTPKHVGALTEYSRNMLLQSSPDIEDLLRDDFAKILAAAVDLAAIKGGGPNEPTGILATAGIGDVPMGVAGGPPTWAAVIALIATVLQADARATGFLTNEKAVAKLRTTVKVASTDSVMIMEGRDSLADYPLVTSSLVPSNLVKGASGAVCSALLFADWSDLLVGYWSELDILVNPYESTAYSKGNVQIRGFITMDVLLRHAASFAAIKDLTTT